jgi:hypothetical protein
MSHPTGGLSSRNVESDHAVTHSTVLLNFAFLYVDYFGPLSFTMFFPVFVLLSFVWSICVLSA